MGDACYAYARWGANAKIKQLQTKYPELTSRGYSPSPLYPQLTQRTTPSTPIEAKKALDLFDLESVLQSSQVISSEIRLEPLLKKLIQILLQNAGAQMVLLVLQEKGRLWVKAQGRLQDKNEISLESLSLEEDRRFPNSLIHYVFRSRKPLLLANASLDASMMNDPYVQEYQPKSVLGLPILRQGQQMGVLYLENNLASHIFTESNLKALTVLSSQLAISIENATLYETSQHALRQEKQALEAQERLSLLKDEFVVNTSQELKAPLKPLSEWPNHWSI